VLLVQWDGYVVNPAAWRAEFLECDYIGATWFWHDDGMRVGNGGFSLRSRKLLDALQDSRILLTEAEDVTICRAFRPLLERDHDIRFAPEALANAFAFEAAYPIGMPFGFHGLFNFSRVVTADELTGLVDHFTPAIARSPQLLQLGRNCLASAKWGPAAAIFQRILEEVPGHRSGGSARDRGDQCRVAARRGRNDPCLAAAASATRTATARFPRTRRLVPRQRRRSMRACARARSAPARRRNHGGRIYRDVSRSRPTTRRRSIFSSYSLPAPGARCRASAPGTLGRGGGERARVPQQYSLRLPRQTAKAMRLPPTAQHSP
jgi:hypothetical protein